MPELNISNKDFTIPIVRRDNPASTGVMVEFFSHTLQSRFI